MAACQSRQDTSDEETLDDRNAVTERTNPSQRPSLVDQIFGL